MRPEESAISIDPRSGRVFDHDAGGYAVFPARYATRLVLEAADLRAMVELVLARCRPIEEEGDDTTISYAADLSTSERAMMERIVRGRPD